VWFVDADDRLPPGSLRAVLDRLREDRPDVLLVDHLRVHEDGRLEADASSHLLRGAPDLRRLLGVQRTAWNRIIRRGHLQELDLRFLPGWYEDVPFSHPVLIGAQRIVVLDRVCYHYRVGRPGAITAARSDRHFEAFDQYERLHEWVAARAPQPWLRACLFTLMINHLLVVAGNEDRVHPTRRRAFFRRTAALHRRHRPAGYLPPAGVTGLKHRLLALDAYPLYAAVSDALGTNRELFPSLADCFADTAAHAAENTDAQWLFLEHPSQALHDSTGFFDGLRRQHRKAGHLAFRPSATLSKNALWSLTDLGVTVRGSVSNELPAYDIPVLQAGWSEWSACGLSTVAEDADAYWKTLQESIEAIRAGAEPVTGEQVRRARLWLWLYRSGTDVVTPLVPQWEVWPADVLLKTKRATFRHIESDADPLFAAVERMWTRQEPVLTRTDWSA
jgi:hypothetical protein